MTIYIGIDLGTTNSAICTYDGQEVKVCKSQSGNDITPSAIFIDKRGNKKYGERAYNSAPSNPDCAALLFKRFMGTSTMIKLPAVGVEMTPEECSTEVLKYLYGYLNEDVRNQGIKGTVITVPAAFNQLQKEATLKAAEMAGLGNVALLQEPVAAIMNVMQHENNNGTFLVYDFGGGTLDVAIAESVNTKVNLITHGGIAMCGGRDFDRTIVDNVVKPWLREKFNLSDSMLNRQDSRLMRMAAWAAEKAKIDLSSSDEAIISLNEDELNVVDDNGNEIYLDININRNEYNALIDDRINESIEATRATIEQAGLKPQDIAKMVFIGGPTNYKPLRDKVSFELGIPGNTDVNPMTAVAEGAAVFAESLNWDSDNHEHKTNKGNIKLDNQLDVQFAYMARTSSTDAKIIAKVSSSAPENMDFQVDSLDTGWSSGRMPLKNGQKLTVSLAAYGDNKFKVSVFDSNGRIVKIDNDIITITKTAATIEGIPSSVSVAVIVLDKIGGVETLDYLVKKGEIIPKKGKKIFKAAESLKANTDKSLTFNLVQGEIENPVRDNLPVGCFEVTGTDFDMGIIPAGAELEFEYFINDANAITASVSVPSIGASFRAHNFYAPTSGKIDYANISEKIERDGDDILNRIGAMENKVDSEIAEKAKKVAQDALKINSAATTPEEHGEAWNKMQEAKKILSKARTENLGTIREIELDQLVDMFENGVKQYAKQTEVDRFYMLNVAANKSLNINNGDFDRIFKEMDNIRFGILWRQDWFVVDLFNDFAKSSENFVNEEQFNVLTEAGKRARDNDDIDELRKIMGQLVSIMYSSGNENVAKLANIIRG